MWIIYQNDAQIIILRIMKGQKAPRRGFDTPTGAYLEPSGWSSSPDRGPFDLNSFAFVAAS